MNSMDKDYKYTVEYQVLAALVDGSGESLDPKIVYDQYFGNSENNKQQITFIVKKTII